MTEKIDQTKIKELLEVLNVLERYNYYVIRRSIGILYLLISATISFGLLIFIYFLEVFKGISLFIISLTFFIVVVIAVILLSGSIFKTTMLYIEKKKVRRKSNISSIMWTLATIIIIPLMILSQYYNLPYYLSPLYIQLMVAVGNLGNYLESRREKDYPGKVKREYLVVSIFLFATLPAFVLFPEYCWLTLTITALGSAYITGLYLILTAEKALEAKTLDHHRKEISF